MRSIHFLLILLFTTILGLFTSCYVETARPKDHKELVIASDYLTQADTTLFAKFIEKTNTRLIIRSINTNQLIGLIRNADHNSGLDVIMMASIHNILRLHKQHILHPLSTCSEAFQFDTSYVSYKYNYVGFGIDPFVVRYDSDTIFAIDEYSELKKIRHSTTFNLPEMISFLSPLRKEMSKVNTYKWIQQWRNNSLPLAEFSNDSLHLCLGTYSSLYDVSEDTILQSLDKVAFPKWKEKGTFYNLRTMGIVKQAENFTVAKSFISFYRNPGYNDQLTKQLHLFRVNLELNPTQLFVLYPYKNSTLMQYHTGIERINKNIDK